MPVSKAEKKKAVAKKKKEGLQRKASQSKIDAKAEKQREKERRKSELAEAKSENQEPDRENEITAGIEDTGDAKEAVTVVAEDESGLGLDKGVESEAGKGEDQPTEANEAVPKEEDGLIDTPVKSKKEMAKEAKETKEAAKREAKEKKAREKAEKAEQKQREKEEKANKKTNDNKKEDKGGEAEAEEATPTLGSADSGLEDAEVKEEKEPEPVEEEEGGEKQEEEEEKEQEEQPEDDDDDELTVVIKKPVAEKEPEPDPLEKYTGPLTTKLGQAARHGRMVAVEAAFANKPPKLKGKKFLNNTAYEHHSPLYWAATYGHTEVVEFLLAKGASVNYSGRDQITPLMGAAFTGQKDVVQLLKSKNAKTNTTDSHHWDAKDHVMKHNAYISKEEREIVVKMVNHRKSCGCAIM
jgi:hypothetical protein